MHRPKEGKSFRYRNRYRTTPVRQTEVRHPRSEQQAGVSLEVPVCVRVVDAGGLGSPRTFGRRLNWMLAEHGRFGQLASGCPVVS